VVLAVRQLLVTINDLLKYFWQNGVNHFNDILAQMQQKVSGMCLNNAKQTKITDFYTN